MKRTLLASGAALAAIVPFSAASAQDSTAPHQHEGHEEHGGAPASQDTAAPTQPEPEAHHHGAGHHDDHSNEIVVTGVRRAAGDVLGGMSILDGADLARAMRPSIGETLARQAGVSSSSFGPTASRPVLRGLGGDRIRVLTDGIGSFDVAASSADHAVAINPLTATRIEVLRGPAALLYGSSAIGGVVNVLDARIPRSVPPHDWLLHGIGGYGSAADERSIHAMGDLALGSNFVAHVDGNVMKTDDLRTGGYILTEELREQALASPDLEIRALADLRGKLPNTASKASEISAGLGYVRDRLNIGASVSRHHSKYGVPIRFSLDPAVEAEAPTIDMRQTRYDARAEVPLVGFFDQVRLRGGYADYRHDELEDTGEIGSSFFSKGGEGRAELVQAARSGWGGTSGIQYLKRSIRIRGEEKFLPNSRQNQTGLFTVQTYVSGPFRVEGGLRVEFSKLTAAADADLGTPDRSRRFTTVSSSGGAAYDFSPGWRGGLTASYTTRAPSIDELFANGPHAGTQSFEVGDPDLDAERSLSLEASIRRTAGPVRLTAIAYYSRFSNFIFQAPTGEIEDQLPVFEYSQGRANYYGFEVEANARLGTAFGVTWGSELVADGVRARIKDFGPAPLIPPLRILAALTGERGKLDGRIEVERAFAHNRTAPLETGTPGYTMVNASVEWHPLSERPELTLSLAANNIFDVVARRSTSLLKDYAPLAGRDIRLGARLAF